VLLPMKALWKTSDGLSLLHPMQNSAIYHMLKCEFNR
jgi:hypothetical protein